MILSWYCRVVKGELVVIDDEYDVNSDGDDDDDSDDDIAQWW